MKNLEENSYLSLVAFVGHPNVGKSTLLNALVGTKIAPTTRKPQTTRRSIRGIVTQDNFQVVLFDTPGIVKKISGLHEFMYEQIFQVLNEVDQIVAIVDATIGINYYREFLKKLKERAIRKNQPLLLVINKIDKLKNKEVLLDLIAKYSEEFKFDSIVPVSAELKDGLIELLSELKKRAKKSAFMFDKDLFTDASEKEIVAELIREKAMLELKEEIPYKIAVTIEEFDESRREEEKKPLVKIGAVLHVERKSQKAIVLGKEGSVIKAIGTRARKEIERLLQCQVMLKLFVRVEPDWTTNQAKLRKLGY